MTSGVRKKIAISISFEEGNWKNELKIESALLYTLQNLFSVILKSTKFNKERKLRKILVCKCGSQVLSDSLKLCSKLSFCI